MSVGHALLLAVTFGGEPLPNGRLRTGTTNVFEVLGQVLIDRLLSRACGSGTERTSVDVPHDLLEGGIRFRPRSRGLGPRCLSYLSYRLSWRFGLLRRFVITLI